MRWAIASSCLIVVAIGLALLAVAPDAANPPPGGPAVLYLGVLLAWGFVGVGAFAWVRRPDNRTGLLMTLVGVGFALTGMQFLDGAWPWVIGAATDSLSASILMHLLLAFPSGRLPGRTERRVTALAYGFSAVQPLAVPFVPCECEGENPLLIVDAPAVIAVLGSIQAILIVASITLTLALLLRRRRASTPAQRRGLDPVLWLGIAILALGLLMIAAQIAGVAADAAQIAFIGAFALLPAAFLAGLVRTRFFRTATVARLIGELTSDPNQVRDALAGALGDPMLDVAYWLPDRGYVDRDGRPVQPGARTLTEIDHEGRRVGALLHAQVLAETPELVFEAAAAAGLAMENARLEVELRARLEALRASRARLVEAGDAERRRLGRDLHDGAQQRLVALMIELQLARERLPADPEAAQELVDSAYANAQAAVGELRDLAAGIHPAVLTQRGLDAALESLASRAPLPVERESSLTERLPIAVETAAYFVVAEALTNVAKYAQATHARVTVRREDGAAVVEIRDDGVGGATQDGGSGLRGLEDRVGVLDGTIEIVSPPGEGTLIRARIPLG